MSDSPAPGTRTQGLLARIAASAEYSIAAALLAVCIVVGGALWWLRPQAVDTPPAAVGTAAPVAPTEDERAAVDDWKRRLDKQFNEIEQQQRQRTAGEETRRARQRAEDLAVEARREAEQAAYARQRAEARMRAQTATPEAAAQPPVSLALRPPAPTAIAQSPPARIDASIDWSSCSAPKYPALSVSRGEEGLVVIVVDLDAQARVQNMHVAQSSGHSRLDRATLDAVRECRFSPSVEDGTPKAATAEVRFTWKLQG